MRPYDHLWETAPRGRAVDAVLRLGYADFLDFAERSSPRPPVLNGGGSRQLGGEGWSGTATFDDALGLAWSGWPEAASKIEAGSRELLVSTRELIARRPELAPVGAFPIVPVFLSGSPDHMLEPSTEREAPFCRILINTTYSAATDSEEVFSFGSACLRLIDDLDAAGLETDVDAVICVTDGRYTTTGIVHVKRAGEMLDLERLGFVLCSTAWLRRLGFTLIECQPNTDAATTLARDGYGSPTEPAQAICDEYDLVIPLLHAGLDEGDAGEVYDKLMDLLGKSKVAAEAA